MKISLENVRKVPIPEILKKGKESRFERKYGSPQASDQPRELLLSNENPHMHKIFEIGVKNLQRKRLLSL